MMLFVPCPRCGAAVEVLPTPLGPERDAVRNVARCDECELAIVYDDVEVQSTPDAPTTN
jgi:hypothetical protein